MKLRKPKFNSILNVTIALLVAYLLMVLVHVQTDNAKTLQGIKRIQADQQRLLTAQANSDKSQKIDSENKLDILICLALVPQDQRTIDIADNCRKETTGASSNADTPVDKTSNKFDNTSPSSSQSVPKTTTSQSTTSQPSSDTTPTPQPSLIQRVLNNVKGIL